jgi:hypothetical protein
VRHAPDAIIPDKGARRRIVTATEDAVTEDAATENAAMEDAATRSCRQGKLTSPERVRAPTGASAPVPRTKDVAEIF